MRRRGVGMAADGCVFVGDGVGVRHLSCVLPAAAKVGRAAFGRIDVGFDVDCAVRAGVYRIFYGYVRFDCRYAGIGGFCGIAGDKQRGSHAFEPEGKSIIAGRRLRHDELFGACSAVCRIGNVFGRAFAARGFNQLWFDLVGVVPDDGKRVDEGKTESG